MYDIIRICIEYISAECLKIGGNFMITKGKLITALLLLSIASFCVWALIRLVAADDFTVKVKGHLQNYVEAGTIETAEEELTAAIVALEKKQLTEGQISIFGKDPNNDIGTWYKNLLRSREELKTLSKENINNQLFGLERQRKGLTGGQDSVQHPQGISIYPYNEQFFWWGAWSIIAIIAFFISYEVLKDNNELDDPLIERKHKSKA